MALQDYTDDGDIIRGSRWPPAEDVVTVSITNTGGWPAGAAAWDWSLLLSRTWRGGTVDLELDAQDVDIVGNVLSATFFATSAKTAALPAGKGRYAVEIKSDDGGDPASVSFYDCVAGTANVRNAAGEG